MLIWIALLVFFQGAEAPFKSTDEFEVKLDFQIKDRPYTTGDADPKIDFRENEGFPDQKKKTGPLPHVAFKVKFLKLSDREVKVRIADESGATVYHKKAKEGVVIDLSMGFIKDIKAGLVSREYDIVLLSEDKKPSSRIRILIQKDGTYLVNDVICGKF